MRQTAARDLLEWSEIYEPPVPVFDLARRLEIRVLEAKDYPALWAARTSSDAAIVWYRGGLSLGSQRFSVALGIGHALHMPFDIRSAMRFSGGDEYKFALDLLMPMEWVEVIGRHLRYDRNQLAQQFQVDRGAIDARFAHMWK